MLPKSKTVTQKLPALVADALYWLPVVAALVWSVTLQAVPFHVPRPMPTTTVLVGDRLDIVIVMAPPVLAVNGCCPVSEAFNVPV